MTPHELAMHCKASVESPYSAGKVTLMVPGSPRGHRIRLDRTSRRKCPMGGDPKEWPDDLRVREWPRV